METLCLKAGVSLKILYWKESSLVSGVDGRKASVSNNESRVSISKLDLKQPMKQGCNLLMYWLIRVTENCCKFVGYLPPI